MRTASEIQSWGEGPTSRESPNRVNCIFEVLAKQNKKNASAQGSLKSEKCLTASGKVPGERKLV